METEKDLAAEFPTDWHMANALTNVEVRQLSEDTYELRSASYTMKVDATGFNLFRHDTLAFEAYVDAHNIATVARTDRG